MGISIKKKLADFFTYLFLIVLVVIVVFPLIYAVAASFKPLSELFSDADKVFPIHPTLENYKTVLHSDVINFRVMTVNSIYYTLINVFGVIMSSSMCAYAFERGRFPGRKTMFVTIGALMFINMGTITVYPKFDILNAIHLNKSLWGLIVLNLFAIPTVNIYLVKSYIATLPKEMDEAAKIDGCSFFGTFIRITMPLLKPILATIGVLAFNGSWNEYLMPTIFTISNPSQQTLMVGINAMKSSGESASNWSVMLAAAVLALVPVLIAYAVGNRYFVKGLSAGAVKG